MTDVMIRLAVVAGACLLAVVGVQILHLITVRLGRRYRLAAELAERGHRPFLLLVVIYTVDVALRGSGLTGPWRAPVIHLLDILAIATGAWLVTRLLFVIEDLALTRYRTDVADNRQARTVHTQIQVVRRITAVVVAVVAAGTALMTFQGARAIGTSVLASAGVVAAIAAFAAQTLLGNLFAGLQLAFSQSLRLDDVVVVEGEWGRIEDITLTYVVVHVWDDRRLILPTSWFTSHPFENWTRSEAALLGTVEIDVDWAVPVDELRDRLRGALTDSEMWDGRVSVLQVTDAVGGNVRLRALVSAANAPTLWDLRCHVREQLVGWLREHHPQALPKVRAELGAEVHPTANGAVPAARSDGDSRVFGGDLGGRQRGRDFTGPMPAVPPAQGRATVSSPGDRDEA